MNTITDLKSQHGRRNRLNVFLDGQFAFSLGTEAAQQAGLETGRVLSQAEVDALGAVDLRQRCHDAALRLLSYRPRSHKEMSDRLSRRGFDLKVVAETLARLEEVGLVDDAAFARMWKDNRQTFHPRSGRLVGIELRRKGVAAELASQMAAEVDDAATAYQTALKKAGTLDTADLQTFRRRLGDYLRRRGFSYEVVNLTVNRLWQEKHPSPEGPRID